MRRAAITVLVGVAALAAAPSIAEAQIEGDGAIVATAVVGTIAGVTNSIAVTVYAVEGRALGSGWVVSSLISSAICGATAVSFVVATASGDSVGVGATVGMLFYGFITAWPAYYVIRSALSEAEPGEYFDADVAPSPTEDPIEGLSARPDRGLPVAAAWAFSF